MVTMQPVQMDLIKLLFNFTQGAQLIDQLKVFWSNYIKVQGKLLMQGINPEKGSSIVQCVKNLIDFKILTDNLLSEGFSSQEDLKNSQREAFNQVLNVEIQSDSSAHYLSIFIHKIMQKDNMLSKNRSLMNEIKQVPFQVIINIFRLIASKDIFENFFSKYLGERLLHRKSSSIDREHELVGLLKKECGQQFFSRVEQMFKDITISEEIHRNYNQGDPRKRKKQLFETEFFILSSGSWPIPMLQMIV